MAIVRRMVEAWFVLAGVQLCALWVGVGRRGSPQAAGCARGRGGNPSEVGNFEHRKHHCARLSVGGLVGLADLLGFLRRWYFSA